jgi:polyhydroxyalkanoate synthesis regulator phasin
MSRLPVVSDVSPAKLSTLPGYQNFLRILREKYNLKSIDMINIVKIGLSIARRLKPDLSIQDFYLLVDNVISQCVKNGKVDLDEFKRLLEHYISKHKVGEAELKTFAEEKRKIEELLQDVKEKLVDFALKFENTEEFEEWFEAWYNEVLSDVRLWRSIAERAKSIDFGELIKSIRLSREV